MMTKSIFNYVDRDKALQFLGFYWWHPLWRWRHGIMEEPFFLHEIYRQHLMHGWPRDIGLRYPARVDHSLARLHQQGPRRKDAFGGDFALTVDITGAVVLRKTVLVQTKLGDRLSTIVEQSQLKEALTTTELAGRCFVMAVDRDRENIRIESMDSIASEFGSATSQKTFNTETWMASSDWILRWLNCEVGRPSSQAEAVSIESLLSPYVTDVEGELPSYPGAADVPGEAPPWLPTFWHHTTINVTEEG